MHRNIWRPVGSFAPVIMPSSLVTLGPTPNTNLRLLMRAPEGKDGDSRKLDPAAGDGVAEIECSPPSGADDILLILLSLVALKIEMNFSYQCSKWNDMTSSQQKHDIANCLWKTSTGHTATHIGFHRL